jgi:hypothetical protein
MAVPTISSISPASGTTAGGNPVVIRGANFSTPTVTSVTFDGNVATFTVNSDTQITANAPAHAAGASAVTVTNADGTSAPVTYTYAGGLTLSPTQGPTGGGTTVSIYSSNLNGTTAVRFGSKLATSLTQVSPTQVNVVSPAGSGTVGVTVTTAAGTSSPANFFYLNPATLTGISPGNGSLAGGDTVTITGTNLYTTTGVTFGGVPATSVTVNSNSQITAVTPAGAASGPVTVVVTTTGGTADNLTFTYDAAPTITSVTPTIGSIAGGDTVTITGANVASTTAVTFGGSTASFGAIDDSTLAVVTPAHAAGTVDVVVTSPGGSATATGAFTYQGPPGG